MYIYKDELMSKVKHKYFFVITNYLLMFNYHPSALDQIVSLLFFYKDGFGIK